MTKIDKLDRTILESIAKTPGQPIIEYVKPVVESEPFFQKIGRSTLYERVKVLAEEFGLINIDYDEKKFRRLTLTPAGLAIIGRIEAAPHEEVKTP